jgi:hypothetical protein
MDEIKEQKPHATTEPDIEGIVRRESEAALRRFRDGDFASRLKANPDSSPARRPFFPFGKSVFAPALGLFILAAGALVFLFILVPGRERIRVEAGFRHMTESLARSELFRTAERPTVPAQFEKTPTGREVPAFAKALFRAAAGSETGPASESAGPEVGDAPLRPLFSPNERFKILYEDRVILRVLTNIANQKEV